VRGQSPVRTYPHIITTVMPTRLWNWMMMMMTKGKIIEVGIAITIRMLIVSLISFRTLPP